MVYSCVSLSASDMMTGYLCPFTLTCLRAHNSAMYLNMETAMSFIRSVFIPDPAYIHNQAHEADFSRFADNKLITLYQLADMTSRSIPHILREMAFSAATTASEMNPRTSVGLGCVRYPFSPHRCPSPLQHVCKRLNGERIPPRYTVAKLLHERKSLRCLTHPHIGSPR